jgi:two-component system NarL family sensor kinase
MNPCRIISSKISSRFFLWGIFWMGMILIFSCKADSIKNSEFKVENQFEKEFEEIYKLIYEDPALARDKAKMILEKIEDSNLQSRIKSLKYIGNSYAFETKYPKAIQYYKEALELAEEIDYYYEIANLHNNLGTIYNEFGNYNSAFSHFILALDNYDLAGNQEKRPGTLNNIGLTYLNLSNEDKALKYFEEALETSPKDSILIATLLNNITISYFGKKENEKALKYLEESILLSEKANNQYGLGISYQILGSILLSENKDQEALEAYTKSLKIAETADLFHQSAVSKIGLARVLLFQNKNAEALKIAEEVLKMGNEKNSLVIKTDVHNLFSEIYEKNGQFQKSLAHFQKHVKLKQELNNNSVVNQIYDVELNQLDQLNKMQKLELEKKEMAISNKNNLLLLMGIIFFLSLIGFYLAYRNHRHKQKVKLQSTILELTKKKSNAALEAEIQERKRIGQELHDSLGYLLSLAGLNASVLQKRKDISEEKKNELLKSLMESIDEAFDEVRNISHNLAPSLLSEQGLKGALKNISDRVNQSHKLKMSYDTFGLNKVDEIIENVLYRTIQEIVNNTIKHAEASELFIQIAQDSDQISLMAEDNGKGFELDNVKKTNSIGLSHIQSWVENLNGNLHIDSQPKRGTIISILIPINQKN